MQLEHFVLEKLGEGGIVIHFSLQFFAVIWNIKKKFKKSQSSVSQEVVAELKPV